DISPILRCKESSNIVRSSRRLKVEGLYHKTIRRFGRRFIGGKIMPKDMRTWIDELDRAGELIRIAKPVLLRHPTELVRTGPVKDVVLKGDQVDLTKLPAHVAGSEETPYIAAGLMIACDPDTGVRNVAFHRLQIKGPRKMGALIVPRHTRAILNKHEERNEPTPIAIFIGHHPLYYMAAATTGAFEMDELELASGLIGEPARV